jgi:hypothetical protein
MGTESHIRRSEFSHSHAWSTLVLAVLLACTGGADDDRPTVSPKAISAQPSAIDRGFPGGFERGCSGSVHGDLGDRWREHEDSIVVGPIALLYPGAFAKARQSDFSRHGSGFLAQKILVVVERGATASIAIREEAAAFASLLYDPADFDSTYQVADGESAVTFTACPVGKGQPGGPTEPTQFNGGFIVAGARCLPVRVGTGVMAMPTDIVISFGAGDCNAKYP